MKYYLIKNCIENVELSSNMVKVPCLVPFWSTGKKNFNTVAILEI